MPKTARKAYVATYTLESRAAMRNMRISNMRAMPKKQDAFSALFWLRSLLLSLSSAFLRIVLFVIFRKDSHLRRYCCNKPRKRCQKI